MNQTSKNTQHSITYEISLIDSLLESLTDGVVLFDKNKKIILTNPSISRMTGLPREGFDLSELTQLFEKGFLDFDLSASQVIENNETIHIPEIKLFRFFYEIFISPVVNSENEVVGGVIILHDVSYYQIQKDLLESAGDGVVAVDKNFTITFFNRAAGLISGWSPSEVIGRPLRDVAKFIRESDRMEDITFIQETMFYGEIRHMKEHTLLITKDGRDVNVADTAAPIFDSSREVVGSIIIFRDASKELEENRLRSDFAYASHQLNTPVAKALWSIEAAIDENDCVKIKEKLETAYQAIKSTKKLVSQLFLVSKIDQKNIIPNLKSAKISSLLDEALVSMKNISEQMNVSIKTEGFSDLPEIKTDTDLLRQVFVEIIDNSISYNNLGGQIFIKALPDGKNGLVFSVEDSGIGILDEQKSLIFTKFFRGSNFDTTDIVGAGLGLFIAREYIRLLGGRIWFESEKGRTVFYVSLPLQ